jgi:hypothetical protein
MIKSRANNILDNNPKELEWKNYAAYIKELAEKIDLDNSRTYNDLWDIAAASMIACSKLLDSASKPNE